MLKRLTGSQLDLLYETETKLTKKNQNSKGHSSKL